MKQNIAEFKEIQHGTFLLEVSSCLRAVSLSFLLLTWRLYQRWIMTAA